MSAARSRLKEKNGQLVQVGSRNNKVGNAVAAGALSTAISSKDSIKITAVQSDRQVFVDSFANNKVDVADLNAAEANTKGFGAALLTHMLVERTDNAANGNGTSMAAFNSSHNAALLVEAQAFGSGAFTCTNSISGSPNGPGTVRFDYIDTNANVVASCYTGSTGSFVTSSLTKYGAYGEPRNSSNVESWPASRFGYTGQVVLADAKLYYYKARVYDPVFGRFLQTDPIGSEDDLDLYAYVGGDPVNKSDPTGLMDLDLLAGGGISHIIPNATKETLARAR